MGKERERGRQARRKNGKMGEPGLSKGANGSGEGIWRVTRQKVEKEEDLKGNGRSLSFILRNVS